MDHMNNDTHDPTTIHFQWAEPYCFPPTRVMAVKCQSAYTEAEMRKVFARLRMRTEAPAARQAVA